jgi:cytochrome oxidase assembly protein ShyY1
VYRFLLTRRWMSLHIVVLLVIPAFILLGRWQFGRYEEHSAAYHRTNANLAAAPVPLGTLDSPGAEVPVAVKYRKVTVSGRYDPAHQLLVRRRTQNSQVGFYVLTPLITDGGQGVLVNRGWVPAGDTAMDVPRVLPPDPGVVTITGRLRPAETEDNSGLRDRPGLPAGQILLINTTKVGKGISYPLYGGFVELTAQTPAPAKGSPEFVPQPDPGGGGGLNFAYGVQWWLFVGIAIGGWFFLIRREARDLKEGRAKEASPEGSTERIRTRDLPA